MGVFASLGVEARVSQCLDDVPVREEGDRAEWRDGPPKRLTAIRVCICRCPCRVSSGGTPATTRARAGTGPTEGRAPLREGRLPRREGHTFACEVNARCYVGTVRPRYT